MEDSDKLGKYCILEELGKGGFATVYRALDTTLEREVALKVLDPLLMRDDAWVERFRREAKAVAKLNHPRIVTIHEIDEADGRLFIAMELVQGPTLQDLIAEQGHLSWDEMLDILAQVAEALDYAHGEGILHRDLKPGNILLDPRRRALLTDFGFAKLIGESSTSVSVSGGVVGTPQYIAPEIWEEKEVAPQTDVYALACIAHELLIGEVLFAGETPASVMRRHLLDGPQFADQWPDGVPAGVEKLLRKALAQDVADRYASAGAFIADMEALTAEAIDPLAYEEEEKAQAEQEQGLSGVSGIDPAAAHGRGEPEPSSRSRPRKRRIPRWACTTAVIGLAIEIVVTIVLLAAGGGVVGVIIALILDSGMACPMPDASVTAFPTQELQSTSVPSLQPTATQSPESAPELTKVPPPTDSPLSEPSPTRTTGPISGSGCHLDPSIQLVAEGALDEESVVIQWNPVDGASRYSLSVAGGGYTLYLDGSLIVDSPTYKIDWHTIDNNKYPFPPGTHFSGTVTALDASGDEICEAEFKFDR